MTTSKYLVNVKILKPPQGELPYALLAYAHHLGVFILIACLAAELALLSAEPNKTSVSLLTKFDGLYGAAAAAVLVVGVCRVILGEKGWEGYVSNAVFWAKMLCFLAAGLVSIRPTLTYIKWKKMMASVSGATLALAELNQMKQLIWVQFALLLPVPLLAAMMARGLYE